jgi:hypothetical protein
MDRTYGRYWPDASDQAICQQFLKEHGELALGMCSLFGAFREQGWEQATAAHMAVEAKIHPATVEKDQEHGTHYRPD